MSAPGALLPEMLKLAFDAGGIDAAEGLAKHLGGKSVYIPKRPKANCPLVLACGRAAANAIAREFGGSMMVIPKGRAFVRRLIAARALANGGSINEAVTASDLHERVVRRVRKDMKSGKGIVAIVPKKPRPRDHRQIDLEDLLAAK